jgi:hypothetical protein
LNDRASVEIRVTSVDGSSIVVFNNVEMETCYDHEVLALMSALENAFQKMAKALAVDETDYELIMEEDDEQ